MRQVYASIVSGCICVFALYGCGQTDAIYQTISTHDISTKRWYSEAQLQAGVRLYQTNCSQCHGTDMAGSFQPDAPALLIPPLNDQGHVWRTPVERYVSIVTNGKGRMPAIALTDQEALLVLAAVQHDWADRKYSLWRKVQAALQ